MKVPASIRKLYEDQRAVNERLKATIDERIGSVKNARWHYESRVKELPSFALKVESGRFGDPMALEDFFACTIVVTNAAEIAAAENLVSENFDVRMRRPKRPGETHKASHAFPFDDLRLYVSIPDDPAAPPSDLIGIVFEIQVKTFLQHAWTIATHDLLYKTDDPSWSKERIAYQIKAMLEHAEVSIQEAERLATCNALAQEDRNTADLKKGIALVKAQWTADELPNDVRRLAQNIAALITPMKIEIGRLAEVLNQGKAQREGFHPSNLSPYATVVQYLLDAEQDKMIALLSDGKARTKILIPQEVELPAGIDPAQLRNAIFVRATA